MSDDEWVKDAMTDEAVVAYMLLRLHRAQPPPLPPPAPAKPALHLGWTVRQRRSRSAPRHGDGKKKAEAARASPTTPLSWSGGTSVSGGVLDGFEESSPPAKLTDGSRSKVCSSACFLFFLSFASVAEFDSVSWCKRGYHELFNAFCELTKMPLRKSYIYP